MKRHEFVIERFNGVSDFAATISKRRPNKVFKGCDLSSDSDNSDFSLTKSYAEATELMTTGYKKGLEALQSSGGFKVGQSTNVHRRIPQAAIAGYAPHVPNAIAGIPQSMIATNTISQKSKTVTILYDGGASAYMDAEDFTNAGRVLMSLIIRLELQGYRVRLDILDAFCGSSEKALCLITVKEHRQPLNPLKISYLLLHPSFFRRHGFRWIETCPELSDFSLKHGYGRPLRHCNGDMSPDEIRKYLRDKNVLEKGTFYTSLYEALKSTPEELAQKMGITIKK